MYFLLTILSLMAAPLLCAGQIIIPNGHIGIEISDGERPFSILGQKLDAGEDASLLISYIVDNWKLKGKPVLLVINRSKTLHSGEKLLYETINRLIEKHKITVILMQDSRGGIPDEWSETSRLIDGWLKKKKSKTKD